MSQSSIDAIGRPVSHQSEQILDLIHRVEQAGERLFTLVSRQADLTPRQHCLLRAIANEPGVTQTRLVETTGIDRSTLSDIMYRMTQKGWCTRKRKRNDARAYGVQLTAAGAEILRNSTRASVAVEERLIEILGQSRRDQLAASLHAIVEALSKDEHDAASPAAATTGGAAVGLRVVKSRS